MKTVIEMAIEATSNDPIYGRQDFTFSQKQLERLVELVREEATAEANARANASWTLMCEKMVAIEREAVEDLLKEYDMVNSAFARDFRARGKEPCAHEWIDDTKAKPAWRCIKCGSDYKKEQA